MVHICSLIASKTLPHCVSRAYQRLVVVSFVKEHAEGQDEYDVQEHEHEDHFDRAVDVEAASCSARVRHVQRQAEHHDAADEHARDDHHFEEDLLAEALVFRVAVHHVRIEASHQYREARYRRCDNQPNVDHLDYIAFDCTLYQ